ncbi:hypothetical protein RHOW815_001327 [Candidatus Rhabdochlamydia sp. W815]|nr:hypothetical protein RHOW815_001327 [Candidatus Rhabdochlamydia sp. W815]
MTTTSLEEKDQELSSLNETLQRLKDEKNTCEANKANLTTTYNITLEEKDREITQLNKQANLTTTSLEEKEQELSSLNETLQHLEDENNICSVKLLKEVQTAIALEKKRRSTQSKLGSIPAQK